MTNTSSETTVDTQVSLLPCPFDGGRAHVDAGWIFCIDCGVGYEGANAAAAWNRRTSSSAEKRIEELETLVRGLRECQWNDCPQCKRLLEADIRKQHRGDKS